MYNLRTELIKSILSSLKIDDNPFNQQIVKDKITHIKDEQLQDFYGRLFDASHQYINGIDRVAKVAEQFKPIQQEDEVELRAKELIKLVYALNNDVYQTHIKTGRTFDDLLDVVQFVSLTIEEEAILNAVAPYRSLKRLVGNINTFGNSLEQLYAFKSAIKKSSQNGGLEISHEIRIKLK